MIPQVPRCQPYEAPPLISVAGETLRCGAFENQKCAIRIHGGVLVTLSQDISAQGLDVAERAFRPHPPQTLDDSGGKFFGFGEAIRIEPAECGVVLPAQAYICIGGVETEGEWVDRPLVVGNSVDYGVRLSGREEVQALR